METVLAGTGGCTAYDVVLILRKAAKAYRLCEVRLTSERAETDPKVFTKILHALRRTRPGFEALMGRKTRSSSRTTNMLGFRSCSERPRRSRTITKFFPMNLRPNPVR